MGMFILGFFIGGFMGILITGLFAAAKISDLETEIAGRRFLNAPDRSRDRRR